MNILVALALVQLTGPTGQKIYVNPAEVTSVRQPLVSGHFAQGVHCVIVTTSGKFISVMEPCDDARQKLMTVHDSSKGPCVLVCGEAHQRQ